MNSRKFETVTKGFTLIELLVVIAILAVLSTVVVLVLNPAELIKQGRDSSRLSDMATLNSAISLFVFDQGSSSTAWTATSTCTAATSTGSPNCTTIRTDANTRKVDGTGWVNLNFNSITSGSPLSQLPIDPANGNTTCKRNGGNDARCAYAYNGSSTVGVYEIDALMESSKYFNGGAADVTSKDGGNNDYIYEVGSNLTLFN